VTPFPQIVCTQALFNVIGSERYGQVPDQVIRYVMGRFGRPTRPVDKEIEARIMDRPRAKEIAAEPAALSLDDVKHRFGRGLSDEELLLRAVMPAEQVDAMLAAGPAKRRYSALVRKTENLLAGAAKTNRRKPAVNVVVRSRGEKADA
jgi:oxaloacetate decarboxylase alpha subunit